MHNELLPKPLKPEVYGNTNTANMQRPINRSRLRQRSVARRRATFEDLSPRRLNCSRIPGLRQVGLNAYRRWIVEYMSLCKFISTRSSKCI